VQHSLLEKPNPTKATGILMHRRSPYQKIPPVFRARGGFSRGRLEFAPRFGIFRRLNRVNRFGPM
jgi:hypothetical protein